MTELMAWQIATVSIGVIGAIVGLFLYVCLSEALHVARTSVDRLFRIAALETPKGSATSKKMARIARGEE